MCCGYVFARVCVKLLECVCVPICVFIRVYVRSHVCMVKLCVVASCFSKSCGSRSEFKKCLKRQKPLLKTAFFSVPIKSMAFLTNL